MKKLLLLTAPLFLYTASYAQVNGDTSDVEAVRRMVAAETDHAA